MIVFVYYILDDGFVFIFYGLYIGIILEGEIGRMYWLCQDNLGNFCGVFMLVLDWFWKNDNYSLQVYDDDYQQMMLEKSLLFYWEEILVVDNQEVVIIEVIYKIIDQKIYQYINDIKKEFYGDYVVLLGGIIINIDYGFDDYFVVWNFEVINLKELQVKFVMVLLLD